MGNNKSSLRSLITDNIEKVRSVKNFYDEVESTIQLELKESRAALQFYKKTFHTKIVTLVSYNGFFVSF